MRTGALALVLGVVTMALAMVADQIEIAGHPRTALVMALAVASLSGLSLMVIGALAVETDLDVPVPPPWPFLRRCLRPAFVATAYVLVVAGAVGVMGGVWILLMGKYSLGFLVMGLGGASIFAGGTIGSAVMNAAGRSVVIEAVTPAANLADGVIDAVVRVRASVNGARPPPADPPGEAERALIFHEED